MKADIRYQGIEWEVGYYWENDEGSSVAIETIKVQGSDVDIYDHLLESTLDGLFEALEVSFK